MNTKNKLNCYIFSNLIVSFLSLNFLVNPTSSTLVSVNNNSGSTLNKIYEKEVDQVVLDEVVPDTITIPDTTTITVTSKEVQSKNTNTTSNITYVKPSYNSVTGASLVNYAKHYLGLPYVSGGYSLTSGTDCSGFTKLIFQEFGINLGRTVSSQIYSGTYVSKSDLKPGDLVFYGHSSNKATHVGIYIGSGLVIHESKPGDVVKINSVDMMVYITARRLITEDILKEVVIEAPKEEVQEKKEEIKEDKPLENEVKEEKIEVEENNLTKEEIEIIDKETEEKITDTKEEIKDVSEENSLQENLTVKEETNTKETNTNLEIKEEVSLESSNELIDTQKKVINDTDNVSE